MRFFTQISFLLSIFVVLFSFGGQIASAELLQGGSFSLDGYPTVISGDSPSNDLYSVRGNLDAFGSGSSGSGFFLYHGGGRDSDPLDESSESSGTLTPIISDIRVERDSLGGEILVIETNLPVDVSLEFLDESGDVVTFVFESVSGDSFVYSLALDDLNVFLNHTLTLVLTSVRDNVSYVATYDFVIPSSLVEDAPGDDPVVYVHTVSRDDQLLLGEALGVFDITYVTRFIDTYPVDSRPGTRSLCGSDDTAWSQYYCNTFSPRASGVSVFVGILVLLGILMMFGVIRKYVVKG